MENHQDLRETLSNPIQIEAVVNANAKTVWAYWNEPVHIQKWNTPSEDWHTTHAENDIRTGGRFLSRMEAKDKSAGFDFDGVYDEVVQEQLIRYHLADGRKVIISFEPAAKDTRITELFEPESENPREMQQGGWQSILDNFKKYVETSRP